MLSQAVGGLLPAAMAVALSPIPIVAVVVVLGSQRARTSAPAFALGWIIGLAAATTVVGAVAAYLVASGRAAGPLATFEQFMADHSAVIMMVVLLLLGGKFLGDGLGAL